MSQGSRSTYTIIPLRVIIKSLFDQIEFARIGIDAISLASQASFLGKTIRHVPEILGRTDQLVANPDSHDGCPVVQIECGRDLLELVFRCKESCWCCFH